MEYYFAYGSNMNPFQMGKRCPNSRFVATGEIKDMVLWYPLFSNKRNSFVASIKEEIGSIVEGVLWSLDDTELNILDKFESFGKNYDRTKIIISTSKGKIEAWVYIAILKDGFIEGIPSEEYIGTINEGKKYFFEN